MPAAPPQPPADGHRRGTGVFQLGKARGQLVPGGWHGLSLVLPCCQPGLRRGVRCTCSPGATSSLPWCPQSIPGPSAARRDSAGGAVTPGTGWVSPLARAGCPPWHGLAVPPGRGWVSPLARAGCHPWLGLGVTSGRGWVSPLARASCELGTDALARCFLGFGGCMAELPVRGWTGRGDTGTEGTRAGRHSTGSGHGQPCSGAGRCKRCCRAGSWVKL